MEPLVIGIVSAAAVGLFAHLIGYDRDRSFYAVVLTVVGLLYVLFNVMAGGAQGLLVEIGFSALFGTLAAIGFRRSLWFVAAGLALHGVFDFSRHLLLASYGVPQWWPQFCGGYDLVAALGLATLLLIKRRGSAGLTSTQPN